MSETEINHQEQEKADAPARMAPASPSRPPMASDKECQTHQKQRGKILAEVLVLPRQAPTSRLPPVKACIATARGERLQTLNDMRPGTPAPWIQVRINDSPIKANLDTAATGNFIPSQLLTPE
ncbi:hypothetical protein PR048_030270 [Dryococelus australis]|uniref:Uncharacterized protein n=1 Tax=Dryococelus australis TaxID=614101 RepID=A0ABQ9G8I1_9NEOP|nr:hypothetical protein PR048_030270 [Dryococelus australis]